MPLPIPTERGKDGLEMTKESGMDFHGTTILAVRRNGRVAMAGDGQVTLSNTVMKGNARKVRKIYEDRVLVGFAGATADAFTLFEHFEGEAEGVRRTT